MKKKETFPEVQTYGPEQLAKKHGVSLDQIMRQLEMGIEIEFEHTKNPKMSREIALDHLLEMPDYYTRLKNMEEMEESEIRDIAHRAGLGNES